MSSIYLLTVDEPSSRLIIGYYKTLRAAKKMDPLMVEKFEEYKEQPKLLIWKWPIGTLSGAKRWKGLAIYEYKDGTWQTTTHPNDHLPLHFA